MTLEELREHGRSFGRDLLPLGAGLRQLADELDCELGDIGDHQRRAYADGWHEAARARMADGKSLP